MGLADRLSRWLPGRVAQARGGRSGGNTCIERLRYCVLSMPYADFSVVPAPPIDSPARATYGSLDNAKTPGCRVNCRILRQLSPLLRPTSATDCYWRLRYALRTQKRTPCGFALEVPLAASNLQGAADGTRPRCSRLLAVSVFGSAIIDGPNAGGAGTEKSPRLRPIPPSFPPPESYAYRFFL